MVKSKSIAKKCKNNENSSRNVALVKDKQSRNRLKEQVAVISTPEGPVEKEIKTNCKIWSFLELDGIKVSLTKPQIDSIREVGFGGMLDIKITKYPPGILAYLVSNFDPYSWVQRITNGRCEREYYLTAADVRDIFGLPINPRNIIQTSFNNKDLVMRWRKFLGVGDNDELKTYMLLDKFREYPDGGDEFKQLFVLYAGSTILAPLPEHKIRYNLLPVVEVVSAISSFDWCQYTLSVLSSSIARILKPGSTHSTVNGCAIVLLVSYCYRVVFKGQKFPMSLPLIKNISDQMLKVRFYEEREAGFGNGRVLVDDFPISEVNDVGEERDCEFGSNGDEVDANEGCLMDDLNDFIKFRIPHGVKTDSDIKAIAKDFVQEACLLLKRDIDVVVHTYIQRLGEATKNKFEDEGVVSVTQQIFQDVDWLSSVDALVEDLIQKTNCSKNMEGCVVADGQSTPVHTEEEADVNLVPSALKEYCSIQLGPCGVDVPYVSQFMISNKEIFNDLRVVEKEVLDYCFLEETMDSFEDIFAFGESYVLSRAEAFSLKNNGKISSVVLDCWAAYLNLIERNQDLALSNKQWFAFVFSTQHCRSLGMLMNEKNDEKANELKVKVIDAWEHHVKLMNANAEIPIKNMFFIPMILEKEEHHVVFVIDTTRKIVCYLDNIKRRKDFKDATTLLKLIVGCFSDFLDTFEHSCADEVLNYNLSFIKMPWTVNEANESSVYAAFFMEQFMGDNDFGPLHSYEDRLKYKALMCSRLVLSDVNVNRDDVLQNLHTFNKEKEFKLPLFVAERQLRSTYTQKKLEEELKRLHELKRKLDEDGGPKRTSRNKLVPVKKITKKQK